MYALKRTHSTSFLVLLLVANAISIVQGACSSCLVSSTVGAIAGGPAVRSHVASPPRGAPLIGTPSTRSVLTFLAYQRLSTHFGHWYSLQSESKEEKDRVEQVTDDAMDDFEVPKTGAEEQVSSGMVAAIGVYKNFISPLLPPACRFVPTCSQYGVEAIQTFGPTKGGILTAWRLMRCSPFGGKGYDPPKWPPVFYTYSSY